MMSEAGKEGIPRLWRLENGLQILVQEDRRFPLAVMRLYVRAGSAMEHDSEAGISHLLEHMAFKGSEEADRIEALGGRINAATGFDYTVYMIDLPSDSWLQGIETLRNLCFRPQWDDSHLQTEKDVVLSELARNEDNPSRVLFERMQGLVWPDTTYSRPIGGDRETIAAISRDDVLRYVRRLYQPQSMLLVVCGEVESDRVVEEAQLRFRQYYNDNVLKAEPGRPAPSGGSGPLVDILPTSWNRAYVGLGFATPGLASGSQPDLEVLAYLLGGDESSRLYRIFQYETSLVEDIVVSPLIFRHAGMLMVQAHMHQDRVEEFLRRCYRELMELTPGKFQEEEMSRAKLNIEDGLFQTQETLTGLASKWGYFQFFEGSVAASEQYLYSLRRLRKKDLKEVIDSYLVPENACLEVLVPQESADSCFGLHNELVCGKTEKAAIVPAAAAEKGETRVLDLDNGCRLVLIPDTTLPYLAVDMTWPGGDLLLSPQEQGLAHLTAETLLRGTYGLGYSRIREMLSERAARMDAVAGRDQFALTAKFPSEFQTDVFRLLQEILTEASFPQEETARVVEETKAVIAQRSDQPMGYLSREVFPFLFQNHPYGFYHLGLPEELEEFDSSSLRSFWQRQRCQPWVLSVCGNGDFSAIEQWARNWAEISQLPSNVEYLEPEWNERKDLTLGLSQRRQAHVLIAFPVSGLFSEVYPQMSLWSRVLSGQGGILFRELRDRQGLGYAVAPLFWAAPNCGFLGFYIGTYPEKIEQAEEGFRHIVEHLAHNGVEAEELRRAKNIYRADYYRQRQPLMSRSAETSEMLAYGLPLDYKKKTAERVAGLENSGMLEAAKRCFRWDRAYRIVLKPE